MTNNRATVSGVNTSYNKQKVHIGVEIEEKAVVGSYKHTKF